MSQVKAVVQDEKREPSLTMAFGTEQLEGEEAAWRAKRVPKGKLI